MNILLYLVNAKKGCKNAGNRPKTNRDKAYEAFCSWLE